MRNLINKIVYLGLFSLLMLGSFNFALAESCPAGTAAGTCALNGLNETNNSNSSAGPTTGGIFKGYDVPTRVGDLIGIVLAFTGTIFFLLTIYGGFLWMTAQGDSAQVKKGKDIIINAALGLVVVFSAYAITTFVGENVSK